MITSTVPLMSNHMERSVGNSVKKREKLEANESAALTPQMMSTIPVHRTAKAVMRFMIVAFMVGA